MENDGVDKGDVESKQNSDIDNLRFSLATMIQEVTSQHNLMTSNIWTIGQISGVIIAFVSVIFIETIAQNINQTWMIITLIFLGISFFIGLYVLISTIQVSLGSDVEEMSSLFREGIYEPAVYYIYNSKVESLENIQERRNRLFKYLAAEIVFLIVGIAMFVVMKVTV